MCATSDCLQLPSHLSYASGPLRAGDVALRGPTSAGRLDLNQHGALVVSGSINNLIPRPTCRGQQNPQSRLNTSMQIQVSTNDKHSSNLFLRCLWANLRKHFGKCAWIYSPIKEGAEKKITFGLMDIGAKESLLVGIKYKKRDSIDEIFFTLDAEHKAIPSETAKAITALVNKAKAEFASPSQHTISTAIEVQQGIPINPYKGELFTIIPLEDGKFTLSLTIDAYDQTDAEAEFLHTAQTVLDCLSAATNTSVSFASSSSQIHEIDPPLPENLFFDTPWLEDYPLQNGRLAISTSFKDLIDKISKAPSLTDEQDLFLRASRHFHFARRLEQQKRVNPRGVASDLEELIAVFYVSALETIALIGADKPQACATCNQAIYSISRRVTDLVDKHHGKYVAKQIKTIYQQRSKFLHAGAILSTRNYLGTSIPQLDSSNESGCSKQIGGVAEINLREFAGSIIRETLPHLLFKAPQAEHSDT